MRQSYMRGAVQLIMAVLVGIVALLSQTSAAWMPQLVEPATGAFRKGGDTISLYLPGNLPVEVVARLALELDDIDISSSVELDGNRVSYSPVTALDSGSHTLRLVEYTSDGGIIERGVWEFSVRATSLFESVNGRFNATLDNSYRAAEKEQPGIAAPDKYYSAGASNLNFSVKNPGWGVDGNLDIFYNEDQRNASTGNQLDLGQYSVKASIGKHTEIRVGNHSVGSNSLIYNHFFRRGVSARFNFERAGASIQAFNQRVDDTRGFDDFFGTSRERGQANGVVVGYKPLNHRNSVVTLSAAYLDAEVKPANFGTTLNTTEIDGQASSFVVDGLWFNQQLRSRFEYARTSNNFEGDQSDRTSDSAYSGFLSYHSPLSRSLQWTAIVEMTEVSPNFYSIANDSLATDNLHQRIAAGLRYQAWSGDIFYRKEKDNRDRQFESTNTVDTYGLNVGYVGSEGLYGKWLGAPEHIIILQSISSQLPQSSVEAGEDFSVTNLQLDNRFTYRRGFWTLLLGYDESEDKKGVQDDESTLSAELDINWYLRASDSINFHAAQHETEQERSNNQLRRDLLSLGLNNQFLQDKLRSTVSIEYQDTDDEISFAGLGEQITVTSSFSVQYELYSANRWRPGVDLAFWSNHHDIVEDSEGGSEDYYEAHVGVTVFWDASR